MRNAPQNTSAEQIYKLTGASHPGRTAFDLSHVRLFDTDIGRLTPVLLQDCIPGDLFEMGLQLLIRAQPLVTPIMHKIMAYVHYFYVPYRILWRDWEKFITGGSKGDYTAIPPTIRSMRGTNPYAMFLSLYGLWDYFGFSGSFVDFVNGKITIEQSLPRVSAFPWLAYWSIWRDYYRDANLEENFIIPRVRSESFYDTEIPVGETDIERIQGLEQLMQVFFSGSDSVEYPFDRCAYRAWQKDYFTSALPFQQRGLTPMVPIEGAGVATWDPATFVDTMGGAGSTLGAWFDGQRWIFGQHPGGVGAGNAVWSVLSQNQVNLTGTGLSIVELRQFVQLQRFLERAARGGARYNEWLAAIFGVWPKDERLQRPEYIGGHAEPVVITETLQTSSTDGTTPQGNMAGHGISVGRGFTGRYHVKEHGLIMAIMSIMPEAVYRDGVPREWQRESRFDYYAPQFAHLSEQELYMGQLAYTFNVGTDDSANDPNFARFGFQPAFDEYRTAQSRVSGRFRNELQPWTLTRNLAVDNDAANSVPLNSEFISTMSFSRTVRQAWAVPGVVGNEQGQFLCQLRHLITAVRPMPYIAVPGLMDHF